MYGAHPAQEHRRVEECIDPSNALESVVPDHTDEQGNGDECNRNDAAVGKPNEEAVWRKHRLSTPLELRKYTFDCSHHFDLYPKGVVAPPGQIL